MKQSSSSSKSPSDRSGGNNSMAAAATKGYSVDELVDRLSRMYSVARGRRSFQRKVVVALKRGVDYGILVKSRNRYRYDPEHSLKISLRRTGVRRKRRRKPTTVQRRSRPSSAAAPEPEKQQQPRVPRPTVPPPPSFQQPPKVLTNEPFNKVIKHSSSCSYCNCCPRF